MAPIARFHFLVNPSAGRKRTRARLAGVVAALGRRGHGVTRYEGREPGDLARHAAELTGECGDRLVVVGGDGTVRAVVNAMEDPGIVPVGVLPAGTANLVAREVGMLPLRSPDATAAALAAAKPWSVDLLEIRREGAPPERALAVASAGADAYVVHAVERTRERAASGGYAKWVPQLAPIVAKYPFGEVRVAVDGAAPKAGTTVIVQNARSYGGLFTLSPHARLDSGVLDVVSVNARGPRDALRLLLAAGMRRAHRDVQVRVERGQRVRISAPVPVPVQIDGDPAGYTDIEVRLRPKALRLLKA